MALPRPNKTMARSIVLGVVVATLLVLGGTAGWCLKGSLDPHIIRSDGLLHELEERIGAATTTKSYTKTILNLITRIHPNELRRIAPEENYELRREEEQFFVLRGKSLFKEGDVVEIVHNRVLAPFKVEAVHSVRGDLRTNYYDDDAEEFVADYSYSIGYDLVRASDGFKVLQIPESSLRYYEPYPIGTEALCNIGDFGKGRDDVEPCFVQDYIPVGEEETTSSGPLTVLNNQYMVSVQGRTDYHTSLPIWKVQRINDDDDIDEGAEVQPQRSMPNR